MLVLDTATTKAFVECLETLEPSKELKVLQFVVELLKNARAYERRIDTLNEELERLMEEQSKLDDIQEPVEQEEPEEQSPYADDDDEEEGGD